MAALTQRQKRDFAGAGRDLASESARQRLELFPAGLRRCPGNPERERGGRISGPEVLDRCDVRTRVRVHDIEQSAWHVRGWVLARCLAHGHTDLLPARGDPAGTARSAAEACDRYLALPFSESRPLTPFTAPGPEGTGR